MGLPIRIAVNHWKQKSPSRLIRGSSGWWRGITSGGPQQRAGPVVCVCWPLSPTLCDPMDCSPWDSSVHGFSRQEYQSGFPCPSPVGLPDPGIEPRSPTLQADSLPSELPGKPKNTGVGCHCLLQGIFLTQESNQGLLHCRQILYHLTHQGSPWITEGVTYPFCRGSSWPRNQTRVSCMADRFLTNWNIREAHWFSITLQLILEIGSKSDFKVLVILK